VFLNVPIESSSSRAITFATIASCALSTFCAAACEFQPQAQTVPGPEAADLATRTHGVVALVQPVGGIQTVRLPDQDTRSPRAPDTGKLPVHCLAGPDALGRIAFIENDMIGKRHALVVLDAQGKETRIFEAQGDALWEHAVGWSLALDASGRRAAFVARAKGVQLKDPDALLMQGELEIWDLAKRERLAATVSALDDMLSWFPDGKHLAYATLIDSSEAQALLRAHVAAEDRFGVKTSAWARVPVVHVLDVETGETRKLHVGERPIVSPDGQTVLLRDFELHWRLLDLDSNRSKPFEAAGAIYPGAIAIVDTNTVLYWAWPTEGAQAKYTEHNSPLRGPKQMRSLKLVDLRDGRFQTAVPYVDPRLQVSFGPDVAKDR
jgi:hypothetical protein